MFPLFKASRSYRLLSLQALSLSLISFSILLRLSFMGIVELLPEEAYSWAYLQNLDFSYLDHPPRGLG